MILEQSMSPEWLSNTWLVGDRPGGHAVLIDTGGPPGPILARVRELELAVTHALCTHHHGDHTAHNRLYRERLGCRVAGHALERDRIEGMDLEIGDGDVLRSGGLEIVARHIPGHTAGQLAFLVNGERVFTGDTLFRGSVGGTRAPGHTTFEDLRRSILDVLMALPAGTLVHPGHTDSTTIGDEWEGNPFVRLWRDLLPEGAAPCTAYGEPATLLLEATDYDGGTKCQVRFDDGRLDVVPGSRVRR